MMLILSKNRIKLAFQDQTCSIPYTNSENNNNIGCADNFDIDEATFSETLKLHPLHIY